MKQDIIYSSALDIVANIKNGTWSSYQVTSAFLEQIGKYNKVINAVSDIRSVEEILKEAQEKDRLLDEGKPIGPLHGLPMTVKDSFCVAGLRSTNGNPKLKHHIASSNAALIQRLKKAGAIIIGKTNIALYALDWQTDNPWFGRCNNPYNMDKIVGGSSGGSAAALSAGFTPLELGTDAGGSIRVPAHFCGVCGIRTTESALPNRGNMETPKLPKLGRYLTVNGGLSRNIDDLILLTKVLWNGANSPSENPPVPFQKNEGVNNRKIKIAYSKNLGENPLSMGYQKNYDLFMEKLSARFVVEEAQPEIDIHKSTMLWGRISGFDMAAAFNKIPFKSLLVKAWIKARYRHKIWAKAMSMGIGSSAYDYARSLEEKDNVSDTFDSFFEDYDVWITPVAVTEAFDHHKTGRPITSDGQQISYGDAFIPYNFPTTIPGHPIVVLPIGFTDDGLPVGVQIHGKKWEDHQLLEIAREIEQLTEGFRIPKMTL